jgi:cytidine deaminase
LHAGVRDHGFPDDRAETELFIGLVGAVGTDLGMVVEEIRTELDTYGYQPHELRLSDYLSELARDVDFDDLPYDERVWEAMTAGDHLRVRWNRGDALALCAITDVVATRLAHARELIDPALLNGVDFPVPVSLQREAFILRSLKTQDELETLRAVYGSRFVLIAASSPDDARVKHLAGSIERSRGSRERSTWMHQPEELMQRDLKEESEGGQDTRGTFHQADFFVRASSRDAAKADLARIFEVLFGHPFRTPTRDEYAQFQAAGAALRSAELGRQVGAALVDASGSVLALGTNEVPHTGGGAHWEDDGRGNREFEMMEKESNRVHQEAIAERLERAVLDLLIGGQLVEPEQVSSLQPTLRSVLLDNGLADLTEYGRAVHAEMHALLDAARRGVPVEGASLHSTTFPCHNCAKHIVAAGIRRVVYIEPYTKSKAAPLHGDSITISRSVTDDEKVAFEPFVGVAPRRYLELFGAEARER